MNSGLSYVHLNVDLQDTFAYVRTNDGQAIAVLSNRMFETFSALKQVEGIRVQLLVTLGEWNDKSKKLVELSRKSKIIIRMMVDVLIFGPRKSNQLQIITEELASSEYYLQEPHYDTIQCSYENPQSLHIPGLQASSLIQAENFSSEVLALQDRGELDDQPSQDQDAKEAALSSLILDIDSFFNDLPKHSYLSYVPIDNRIQTTLLEFVITPHCLTLKVRRTDTLL